MADQQAFAEAYRQLNPNATPAQIQSTFNVFNPPAAGVPAASLSPGVPMSLPKTNPQQEASKLNALTTSFGAEALAAEGEQQQAQGSYDSASNDLINLSKQLENQTADQFTLENQSGIPEISKDLLELQNQARQRNLQYQKQFITAEGQPIPMGVIVGQQAQLQRQEAVDIALINSNIQAKQGQLALAQSTVDRALAAKYEPLKARLETQKLILQQGYDKLTRAEQKLRDAKIEEKNLKLKEIENEEEEEKAKENIILDAIAFGAPNSLINQAKNAPTNADAAKILQGYSGDYAKAELLKSQLKTEKLQQANINSTIADRAARLKLAQTESTITGGGKPPTIDQANSAIYAARIASANKTLEAQTPLLQKMNAAQFKAIASNNMFLNKTLSPQQQQAAQAMRSFITAVLRKESGASISPSEFEQARLQYFPQYGDSQEVINQKKETREIVQDGFIVAAGQAYQPQSSNTTVQSNPFMQAIGATQPILGTSILAPSKGGGLNFIIPNN